MISLQWQDGVLSLLDQAAYPQQEHWITCSTVEETAQALSSGAILEEKIAAVAGVYGYCLAAMAHQELQQTPQFQEKLDQAKALLLASRPGSRALAASVAAALGTDGLAVLLRNHGSLCCGRDLPAAMTAAAYVEEAAQVAYYASALGRFTPLGEADIRACKEMLAAGRAV